jgi:hypothetical protein
VIFTAGQCVDTTQQNFMKALNGGKAYIRIISGDLLSAVTDGQEQVVYFNFATKNSLQIMNPLTYSESLAVSNGVRQVYNKDLAIMILAGGFYPDPLLYNFPFSPLLPTPAILMSLMASMNIGKKIMFGTPIPVTSKEISTIFKNTVAIFNNSIFKVEPAPVDSPTELKMPSSPHVIPGGWECIASKFQTLVLII